MLGIFNCTSNNVLSINTMTYVPLDMIYASYLLYLQINKSASYKIKALYARGKALYNIVSKQLLNPKLLLPLQIRSNAYPNNKLLNIYTNIIENV